jgi:hypothetical protein
MCSYKTRVRKLSQPVEMSLVPYGPWAGRLRNRSSNPGTAKDFSLVHDIMRPTQSEVQQVPGDVSA